MGKESLKMSTLIWRKKRTDRYTGLQITPSPTAPYRAVNWNFRKFGATCRLIQWLHQGKVHMERKSWERRAWKCKPWVGAKSAPTWTGLQTPPSPAAPYMAVKGNLRKFGATCHPVQWLYQCKVRMKRKLCGRRTYKCEAWVGAKSSPTWTGLQTTPSPVAPYRAVNEWGRSFLNSSYLRFLLLRYLHWCKVCTGQDLGENLREFPLTALYAVVGDGHIGRPVMVCALFAPNKGIHF